jgi:hypothetical protein
MEDWVAIEVKTDAGRSGYFLTWGRIQDAVDPRPLEELAVRAAARCSLGGRPTSARVCTTLQEAAGQPYFFEALLTFSQTPIPRGGGYGAWREATAKAMADGHEFYFLGRQPKQTTVCHARIRKCLLSLREATRRWASSGFVKIIDDHIRHRAPAPVAAAPREGAANGHRHPDPR